MQVSRLFALVYALLEKGTLTASELSERLQVSVRTVYRDAEALSMAGIPIYMSRGRGGGIALLPEFSLDKAVLTEQEKSEVLSSLHALKKVAPDTSESALKKLGTLFNKPEADWLEVDFSAWSAPLGERERFALLKNAVLEKRVVSFLYVSNKGETLVRVVEPFKLCFRAQAWYLYGFCRARKDCRFFKLRRMRELAVLNERFQRDSILSAQREDYAPSDLLEVTLKLAPQAASRVLEEFENAQQMEDGSFLVCFCMPHGEPLFQYVLSFGEQCEVISPPQARQEIARRLKKMLERYE